jgi:hypothetical protein
MYISNVYDNLILETVFYLNMIKHLGRCKKGKKGKNVIKQFIQEK